MSSGNGRMTCDSFFKEIQQGNDIKLSSLHPFILVAENKVRFPSLRNSELEPATLKVPVQSCGGAEGCHITATTDDGGALNYEIDQKKANAAFVCVKCHITFGKDSLPANHLAAIPQPTKK